MNAEEKKRYFAETALALNREGFHAETILGGTLGVWLDDEPLCEVSEVGGITYRGDNISTPERVAAKDKAYRIVSTTAEYMRQMEQAPLLIAVGLEDQYKLLAEFNGSVLAGMYSRYGVQFVTWERDQDRSGLHWGHYFTGNYEGAKQDFATRSGLISEQQLFKDEQLIEIYRCCADTLDAGFDLTYEQEKCIKSVQEQIENGIPVWLYPSTLDAIDRACEKINCKSRSDFLERAAQFYVGYIAEQDACAYLPPALATAIRGSVLDTENRIARLLFKLAVEVDMTMNVVAGNMGIDEDALKQLRARCVQEVKKTSGTIGFEDAVKYQRGK